MEVDTRSSRGGGSNTDTPFVGDGFGAFWMGMKKLIGGSEGRL